MTNSSEQEASRLSEELRAHRETYAHSPDEVYLPGIMPCEAGALFRHSAIQMSQPS